MTFTISVDTFINLAIFFGIVGVIGFDVFLQWLDQFAIGERVKRFLGL